MGIMGKYAEQAAVDELLLRTKVNVEAVAVGEVLFGNPALSSA